MEPDNEQSCDPVKDRLCGIETRLESLEKGVNEILSLLYAKKQIHDCSKVNVSSSDRVRGRLITPPMGSRAQTPTRKGAADEDSPRGDEVSAGAAKAAIEKDEAAREAAEEEKRKAAIIKQQKLDKAKIMKEELDNKRKDIISTLIASEHKKPGDLFHETVRDASDVNLLFND